MAEVTARALTTRATWSRRNETHPRGMDRLAAGVRPTADRLKIFPTRVDPEATRATVRTEVTRANADRVAVNYYLHKTPEGWKAWDVVIDGSSYVNSYRTDFGEQIEAQGIDAVIKRLEAGEKPGAIGKQTGDKSG